MILLFRNGWDSMNCGSLSWIFLFRGSLLHLPRRSIRNFQGRSVMFWQSHLLLSLLVQWWCGHQRIVMFEQLFIWFSCQLNVTWIAWIGFAGLGKVERVSIWPLASFLWSAFLFYCFKHSLELISVDRLNTIHVTLGIGRALTLSVWGHFGTEGRVFCKLSA